MRCDGCLTVMNTGAAFYEVLTGPHSGALICGPCKAASGTTHPIKYLGLTPKNAGEHFEDYTLSVPGHSESGTNRREATVYANFSDGLPCPVARGIAKVRSTGPVEVEVDGFRPLFRDGWRKLPDGGPGEWVCAAEAVEDASGG